MIIYITNIIRKGYVKLNKNIILCVWVFYLELLECLVPGGGQRGAGCPETGVNTCEPPCGPGNQNWVL